MVNRKLNKFYLLTTDSFNNLMKSKLEKSFKQSERKKSQQKEIDYLNKWKYIQRSFKKKKPSKDISSHDIKKYLIHLANIINKKQISTEDEKKLYDKEIQTDMQSEKSNSKDNSLMHENLDENEIDEFINKTMNHADKNTKLNVDTDDEVKAIDNLSLSFGEPFASSTPLQKQNENKSRKDIAKISFMDFDQTVPSTSKQAKQTIRQSPNTTKLTPMQRKRFLHQSRSLRNKNKLQRHGSVLELPLFDLVGDARKLALKNVAKPRNTFDRKAKKAATQKVKEILNWKGLYK